ncbi:hypothetical protein EXN66_Car007116 [Channa argus]|uniref:Uncharacterized protein n=1 Tax=Channa argus TaxID=215402 RepID=A0A6G1PM83_CHAAH|nr:hypothetical protein EXN66_Car007116 [Channa argus]
MISTIKYSLFIESDTILQDYDGNLASPVYNNDKQNVMLKNTGSSKEHEEHDHQKAQRCEPCLDLIRHDLHTKLDDISTNGSLFDEDDFFGSIGSGKPEAGELARPYNLVLTLCFVPFHSFYVLRYCKWMDLYAELRQRRRGFETNVNKDDFESLLAACG